MPDEGVTRRRAGGRLMRDEKDNEKKNAEGSKVKGFRAKLCYKGIVVCRAGARPQRRICSNLITYSSVGRRAVLRAGFV